MKRLLFGIVLLLVITSVAYSQEPTQPLQLTINSDKKIYGAGEEIKIKLVFQNNTQEKIAIFKHILMTYNIKFQISVITPTGEKFEPVVQIKLYKLPVFKRDIYQEILPNKSFEIIISLKDYFDELYDTSIVPGNYKISVKYSNDFDYYYDENAEKIKIDAFKGILTSNTINIEVVGNRARFDF